MIGTKLDNALMTYTRYGFFAVMGTETFGIALVHIEIPSII